ncbi:hypothetical protein FB451DRAFT_1286441 [Mycena latifolia]|nr:hypothetical protein FB451DRAFT_1286441 [Mycena latifolia]
MTSSSSAMRIPEAIAWNSETHPTGPYYLFATAHPLSSVVTTITHLEFGRATHRAAQVLRPNRVGKDREVVTILANSDTILYHAVVAGLITADLIPFPISPTTSATAIVNLLRNTSCHRLIATCVTLGALVAEIKQDFNRLDPDFSLRVEEMPPLAEIYPNLGVETADCAFEAYPASPNEPEFDDICLYLHSSGSTGFPKAIPETHRALMQWSKLSFMAEMRDHSFHPVAAMHIPVCHQSGLYMGVLFPVYGRIPVAVYPPTAISPDGVPLFPSPENVVEHARKTDCKALFSIPSLLAALSRSPEAVDLLKAMRVVAYSGGTLPQRVGNDLVNAGVSLRSLYGATEFGIISSIIPWEGDENDWEWVRFSEKVKPRWDPQGDETFICQVVSSEEHSVSIQNLKDVGGYATSDLWRNHPEKKHLWKMVGRIDDVIVHSSGKKTMPAPMEDIVLTSPHVLGAVIFGWGRTHDGILIEPISSLQLDIENTAENLRNKIWTVLEEANQTAEPIGRISKEMIIFTSPDKPLPRTGKRTVMRKAALQLYAPEIDALYNAVDQ